MNSIKDTLLKLQYQYSKLFVISIPRRKFEYTLSDNKFVASNTSRNTIISIAFLAFASLLLLSGVIELCSGKISMTIDSIIVFFVIHPFVGIFALRQFLWLVNGKEILTIENGLVKLEKKELSG